MSALSGARAWRLFLAAAALRSSSLPGCRPSAPVWSLAGENQCWLKCVLMAATRQTVVVLVTTADTYATSIGILSGRWHFNERPPCAVNLRDVTRLKGTCVRRRHPLGLHLTFSVLFPRCPSVFMQSALRSMAILHLCRFIMRESGAEVCARVCSSLSENSVGQIRLFVAEAQLSVTL